jgi:phosphatidylglycerophosphatase A
MATLKTFSSFKPSKSNVYTEDEMRTLNIAALNERGVTIQDIAFLSYNAQSKYLDDLTYKEMEDSVMEILGKRDQFHAIMLAVNIDFLAENNMLMEPLQSIIRDDLGLFGLDEAIAISIAGNYGTIGVTNFGALDVHKPGKISILQNKEDECHCFLDDVVGAIAAVAAIRVAQHHALEKASNTLL